MRGREESWRREGEEVGTKRAEDSDVITSGDEITLGNRPNNAISEGNEEREKEKY